MERVLDKPKTHASQTHASQPRPRAFPLSRQDAVSVILGVFGLFLGRLKFLTFLSPVGPAFLGLFLGTSHQFYIIMILTGVGLATSLSGVYLAKYLAALAALALVNAYMVKKHIRPNVMTKAAVSGGAALFCGLGMAAYENMSLYFAVVSVAEAVLVGGLAIVLRNSANVLAGSRKRRLLSNEEIISLAVLLGGVIAGASNIEIYGVPLRVALAAAAVMIIAHKAGGVYAFAAGTMLGLAQVLVGAATIEESLALGIAGLAAGIFREKGKPAVAGGFAVGFVVTEILLHRPQSLGLWVSVLGGAAVFAITPANFYFNFNTMVNPVLDNTDEYLDRVREIVNERLMGFSRSFAKLAKTFSLLSAKKASLTQGDVHRLIEDVSDKACAHCAKRETCWQTNFYDTYQTVFGMLGACEKRGAISDIPENFQASCVNAARFAEATARVFEIYKTNLAWHNRIVESRELVSEQLTGVAGIIAELSRDMDMYMNFKTDAEESIAAELAKNRIEVENVIVLENRLGKCEVTITQKPCFDRKNCGREIVRIVSGLLGRKMKVDEGQCGYRRDFCRVRLLEEQKYRVFSGAAKKQKAGSAESGDSFSFMELKNGQCILALSDGMGSGAKAREESAAAIELLEEFIESGFEKDIAVKIINSVLVLKSSEESFATLDICAVDLYTGDAEFVKIGAAATYLLREGAVSVIQSKSLPMGMLPAVDIEKAAKRLRDGDIIVMVTDGMDEPWVADALREMSGRNPQDIADELLAEAETRGDATNDDLTVLAAKIWERV